MQVKLLPKQINWLILVLDLSVMEESAFDERFVTEKLRIYNEYRLKVLDYLNPISFILENIVVFHTISWIGALGLIAVIYAQILELSLFSLHPTCMIIGCILCIGEGIVSFRNKCVLSSFSPIMSGTKRTKIYSIHRTFQVMGISFITLGFIFIFSSKLRNNHIVVPYTPHGLFGIITIFVLYFQMYIGYKKIHAISTFHTKIFRFHSDLGLFAWDCLCISILFGCLEFLIIYNIFNYICTLLTICILWYNVHVQLKKKIEILEEDKILEGSGGSAGSSESYPILSNSSSSNNNGVDEEEDIANTA